MRLRSILTILLASVAMLLPVSRAMAQAELPASIIEKSPLSSDDTQQIDKFMSPRMTDLSSSETSAVKKAKDELLRPFRNPRMSVAFRQYFGDKIREELKKNAGNPSPSICLNSLIIAGYVATTDTTTLLESKLKDPDNVIRFAAVNGLERTMEAVANRSPAVTADAVRGTLGKLSDVISDPTSNAEVMDAGFRALRKAIEISRPNFEVRSAAVEKFTDAAGKLSQRNDVPAKVLLRASAFILEAYTNDPAQKLIQGDSVKKTAQMSGQLLSWAACQIKSGKLPVGQPDARQDATQVVKAAERTIQLAGERVNKRNPGLALADDFAKATAANDKVFFTNLLALLKPLSEEPFNIPAESFLQCK